MDRMTLGASEQEENLENSAAIETEISENNNSENPENIEKKSSENRQERRKKSKKEEEYAQLSVEERLRNLPVIPEAQEMVLERLVPTKMLANRNVLKSVMKTPRALFVSPDLEAFAYQDITLPIGASQTISPPFVVAYMTEQLNPQPTDNVLEIGTGSGYQAAVLSPLVADVWTIEIVPSLGKKAAETLKKLEYPNVHVKVGDGYKGWPEAAPFDKIIVTCSPENIPQPLLDQLAEGGQILIPVGERYDQHFYRVTKKGGEFIKETLISAYFVPMTGEAEAKRQIQPDPAHPSIRGGDFQEADENGNPVGWFYTRNLKIQGDLTALDPPVLGEKSSENDSQTPKTPETQPEDKKVIVFDNRSVEKLQRKKDALRRRELTAENSGENNAEGGGNQANSPNQNFSGEENSEAGENADAWADLDYDPLTLRQRAEELTSHALQGFAVDGRKVKKLDVFGQMEGVGLEAVDGRRTITAAVLIFFDENRESIGETIVFALSPGDTPWKDYSRTEIAVPRKAREAALRIGILNGIGILKMDNISIRRHQGEKASASSQE